MRVRFLPEELSSLNNPFLLYAVMIMFVMVADSTMSYAAPIVMDRFVGNTSTMGVILALSSVVGTAVDFFFAKAFGNKKAVFFDKLFLSLVVLFPLSFLVWKTVPSFIFGMIVWGVYYEGVVFSNFHIIHEYVSAKNHGWAWGILALLKNIGLVIGPLAAAALIDMNTQYPFIFALGAYMIASFLFFVGFVLHKRQHHVSAYAQVKPAHKFKEELLIWKKYIHVLWPLLSIMFTYFLIDSTFFSIGTVFGEALHDRHALGWLFITAYTIPGLIFGVLVGIVAKPFGKKRAAFLAGVLAGVGLITMSQLQTVPGILFATFVGSIGLALSFPLLCAVFEDYVARAGKFGNDMIGLTAIMGSIGYVVGPIVNGFLADHIGTQAVFGMWGGIMLFLSFLALAVVKRKVKVPHREIEEILIKETITIEPAV